MNHPTRLRDIAELVTGRGLPVSAQQLREIAADLEPKPLLSANPTEDEIEEGLRINRILRRKVLDNFETLIAAQTKLQLAKGTANESIREASGDVRAN